MMVVAICVITLNLSGVTSLKEKRRILKSILARLSQKFNVATAEVDHQDVWQTAVIALATIGNDSRHLHRSLENAIAWLESSRPDVPIDDYRIEFL